MPLGTMSSFHSRVCMCVCVATCACAKTAGLPRERGKVASRNVLFARISILRVGDANANLALNRNNNNDTSR